MPPATPAPDITHGGIFHGDCLELLPTLPAACARLVIADPPHGSAAGAEWEAQWSSEKAYLDWSMRWLKAAMRTLVPGGLLYCFGQTGGREHHFIHLMSRACEVWDYHDLLVWDRVVGTHERDDSFTPAYEMVLVLRKEGIPYFNKDVVREPYDMATRQKYARDTRYKDLAARMKHLNKGKKATNLWRLPPLRGGHHSRKPVKLVERIIRSSSQRGELIIDPFVGKGTTAAVAHRLKRPCIGIERDAELAEKAQARLEGIRAKRRQA